MPMFTLSLCCLCLLLHILYVKTYTKSAKGRLCAVQKECEDCGENVHRLYRGDDVFPWKVCCPTCSRYLRSGYYVMGTTVTPWCSCDFDLDETNCGVDDECKECGENVQTLTLENGVVLTVCCRSCSKYFRSGYSVKDIRVRPWCECDNDGFNVSTNCWKGEDCDKCGNNVKKMKSLPVCCADCGEELKMVTAVTSDLKPTSCYCGTTEEYTRMFGLTDGNSIEAHNQEHSKARDKELEWEQYERLQRILHVLDQMENYRKENYHYESSTTASKTTTKKPTEPRPKHGEYSFIDKYKEDELYEEDTDDDFSRHSSKYKKQSHSYSDYDDDEDDFYDDFVDDELDEDD